MRYLLLVLVLLSSSALAGKDKPSEKTHYQSQKQISKSESYSEGSKALSSSDSASNADSTSGASSSNSLVQNYKANAPRSVVSHAESTALDQKVRSVSGGWLTGSAGFRWDATDKELRALRRADAMRDRGQIAAANKLECAQKVIYKGVGGDPDECYTLLSGSEVVVSTINRQEDVERDLKIIELEKQIQSIKCDHPEEHDRIFSACQSK